MTQRRIGMEPILFLSDARGIFIPRDFALAILPDALSGVSQTNMDILKSGPDHEYYWDAWNEVCDRGIVTNNAGIRYRIHQDGDCWLVPEGMEFPS